MSSYCVRTDLENEFGATNIAKWADPDNDEVEEDIEARIEWAIGKAANRINDMLRQCRYTVPFSDYPNAPQTIREVNSTLAGVLLYRSPRGLIDGEDMDDRIKSMEDEALKTISKIQSCQIDIGATIVAKSIPFVVQQ